MPDWLSRSNPVPPEELAAAIRSALGDSSETPTAEEMLRAAETLLQKVLLTNCEARSSALDLLTVDALVTQALLVASGDGHARNVDGNAPDDFAARAMRRLSTAWP
jgi:hypothetical protein